MTRWNKFREAAPKWGGRIIFSFVVLAEAAHKLHLLEAIGVSQEKLIELFLTCVVVLCFLQMEEFGATEQSVETLSEHINRELNGAKDIIVKQTTSLTELNKQFELSINVARFTDTLQFKSNWKHLRDDFDLLIMRGTLGDDFISEIGKLVTKGKPCEFYLSIESSTQETARAVLNAAEKLPGDTFKLFEVASKGAMSWALARNKIGRAAQAMICYPVAVDGSINGLYLTGNAALDFSASMNVTLRQRKMDDDELGPVRVYSQHQLDVIVSAKESLREAISDLDRGDFLRGVEDICEAMINNLQRTNKTLDVTHLCEDERGLSVLIDDSFIGWLEANYEAIKRGVMIRRIFIMPRRLKRDQRLLDTVAIMRAHNMEIHIRESDGMPDVLRKDFSIYDARSVVYIFKESESWSRNETFTCARNCDNLERVRSFQTIFNALKSRPG